MDLEFWALTCAPFCWVDQEYMTVFTMLEEKESEI